MDLILWGGGGVWGNSDFVAFYFRQDPDRPSYIDTDVMGLTNAVFSIISDVGRNTLDSKVRDLIKSSNKDSGRVSIGKTYPFDVNCGTIVWAMGGGTGFVLGDIIYRWEIRNVWNEGHLYEKKWYEWQFWGNLRYYDEFKDVVGILNLVEDDIEFPDGRPYQYGHTWFYQFLGADGYIWARMIE